MNPIKLTFVVHDAHELQRYDASRRAGPYPDGTQVVIGRGMATLYTKVAGAWVSHAVMNLHEADRLCGQGEWKPQWVTE